MVRLFSRPFRRSTYLMVMVIVVVMVMVTMMVIVLVIVPVIVLVMVHVPVLPPVRPLVGVSILAGLTWRLTRSPHVLVALSRCSDACGTV
jgi:hypothetical protein